MSALTVLVLGSAAGGGFPQWNCRCRVCQLYWSHDPRVVARSQSSIAVSADGQQWLLINASPDLRQQIIDNPVLHPASGSRHSPIKAVAITNADVDHIAGLLHLRERQELTVFATATTHQVLGGNSVFNVLDANVVTRAPMVLDAAFDTGFGLMIRAFAVPGKVALFLEDDTPVIGEATETTIGLDITANGRRVVYIPGCAAINDQVLAEAAGADLLLFDGTTFTDDEMPALGLSSKTARRMGHTPISGSDASIAAFSDLNIQRRAYIHINNTNPILIRGSVERTQVEAMGWDVTEDGMVITL